MTREFLLLLLTLIYSKIFYLLQKQIPKLDLLGQRFILQKDMNFIKKDIQNMNQEKYSGMQAGDLIGTMLFLIIVVLMRLIMDNMIQQRKQDLLPDVVCF